MAWRVGESEPRSVVEHHSLCPLVASLTPQAFSFAKKLVSTTLVTILLDHTGLPPIRFGPVKGVMPPHMPVGGRL